MLWVVMEVERVPTVYEVLIDTNEITKMLQEWLLCNFTEVVEMTLASCGQHITVVF